MTDKRNKCSHCGADIILHELKPDLHCACGKVQLAKKEWRHSYVFCGPVFGGPNTTGTHAGNADVGSSPPDSITALALLTERVKDLEEWKQYMDTRIECNYKVIDKKVWEDIKSIHSKMDMESTNGYYNWKAMRDAIKKAEGSND
jgi:DNA-directed RNA polymerase subunit RPC12/RpoP